MTEGPSRGAPLPADEASRLSELRNYAILDTPPEEVFDRITRLASTLLGTPIALVSLVDEDRQWFKSRVGLEVSQTPRELAFCGYAILDDDVFTVADAADDARFAQNPLVTGDPNIRFYAGAPLTTPAGFRLGTLCVIDRQPRTLEPEQAAVLRDLADLAGRELELRRLASLDSLTGVLNRNALLAITSRELARPQQGEPSLHAALIDLDGFKPVNDTFGHTVGDRVLREVADLCSHHLRSADWFGRLGGDEFGLVLPRTDAETAVAVADRVRRAIAAESFSHDGADIHITASIGVTAADSEDYRSARLDGLWHRADTAMYKSKATGDAVTYLPADG